MENTCWYISNNSTKRYESYGIGRNIMNVIKGLQECIAKHGWKITDDIIIISEDDAYYPGAVIIGYLND